MHQIHRRINWNKNRHVFVMLRTYESADSLLALAIWSYEMLTEEGIKSYVYEN